MPHKKLQVRCHSSGKVEQKKRDVSCEALLSVSVDGGGGGAVGRESGRWGGCLSNCIQSLLVALVRPCN